MSTSDDTPSGIRRKANGRRRFPNGMPEQSRTLGRQKLAWSCGIEDYLLRRSWRNARRYPEALYLRCHEVAAGPNGAEFLGKVIFVFDIDPDAVVAVADKLARRQRFSESLAGWPMTRPPRGTFWGNAPLGAVSMQPATNADQQRHRREAVEASAADRRIDQRPQRSNDAEH